MSKFADSLQVAIKHIVEFIFVIILILLGIALFDRDNKGEAPVGDFSKIDFTKRWQVSYEDKEEMMDLPGLVEVPKYTKITLTNELPDYITDGMSMMVRTNVEDINVYVGDELRSTYSTAGFNKMVETVPSAYIVTSLTALDADSIVKIELVTKGRGYLPDISLSYGNNSWFSIFKDNIVINAIAMIVLIMGLILAIVSMAIKGIMYNNKAPLYMGLLMMVTAIWVLSESRIRQLIFARSSLAAYFAYMAIELLGALIAMYFDEVQHRQYRKRYLVAEALIVAQVVINTVLQITGLVEFYDSLIISHVWMGLGICLSIWNLIEDTIKKRTKEYSATAIGILCFLFTGLLELISFYNSRVQIFGLYVSIGLIILMVATVIQILLDEKNKSDVREKEQTKMIISTIETISSAIDAKDEYTGYHSERVGEYAAILSREIAPEYGFTEDDILHIQYIGLMHDIGKIGVADTILNKAGKLTDEEFSLMKKHVNIGYELLSAMKGSIDGLLDGIRYHHERYDGKGYPDGLAGEDIPLIARILCLADCYDAMTSNRVYRKRLTDEEVRNEYVRCAGTQFDPKLAEVFIRLIDEGKMSPETHEGIALDNKGKLRLSSVLENRLQKDLLNGVDILNPTHVRMLCYIIKLMENKNEKVNVLLLDNKIDNEVIKDILRRHDVNIEYTKDNHVVAFMKRSDMEINAILETLGAHATEIK